MPKHQPFVLPWTEFQPAYLADCTSHSGFCKHHTNINNLYKCIHHCTAQSKRCYHITLLGPALTSMEGPSTNHVWRQQRSILHTQLQNKSKAWQMLEKDGMGKTGTYLQNCRRQLLCQFQPNQDQYNKNQCHDNLVSATHKVQTHTFNMHNSD
jgi:hypothetical protein